jgi:hypothetical protein
VVDRDREERLDRMRRRQLQWATSQLCRSMVMDMMDSAVHESSRRMCKEIMVEEVVNKAWLEIEFLDIMRVMDRGDISLRARVEQRLKEDRELIELEEATMDEMDVLRKSKVEALKALLKERRLQDDIRKMTDALATLQLEEWNMELEQLVSILDKMILEMPTIPWEDVQMTDPGEELPQTEIVWAAEKMDTDMVVDKEIAMETGTDSGSMELLVVEGTVIRMEESVMVVVSHVDEEPHHHGGLLTPVQIQTIMSEKGLESGDVLGVQCTVDPVTGGRTPLGASKTDAGLVNTSEARLGCDNICRVYTHTVDSYDILDTGRAGIFKSRYTVKDKTDRRKALTHPISQPEKCSEAIARIGLVPDGVGPKKLKIGENHRPGPAVEPLLGGGEGG